MADEFVKVASVSDIPPGDMMSVKVGTEEILLVNVGGALHACDDICTHAYANLSEGDLEEDELVCPLHGAVFDVASGRPITPPATEGLRKFAIRVEGDDVLVGPVIEAH
jgi:3-phenylpropionate/trans-cinnamate dioxygenase ferredoxin subunit